MDFNMLSWRQGDSSTNIFIKTLGGTINIELTCAGAWGEVGRQEECLLSQPTWQHHEATLYSSAFVVNFLVYVFVLQRGCTNCLISESWQSRGS